MTFVEVQDNFNNCNQGSKVALGGKIANEDNESVEGVRVELSTGDDLTTSNTGEYGFQKISVKGMDYTITPQV
ncbi:MAG: hypothetical protein R2769_02655 [Saprospiraceae bacterium]